MYPQRISRSQLILTAGGQRLGLMFLLLSLTPSLDAAIVPTGDVSPGLPWSSSTDGYIGNTSDGSLWVDAGSQLASNYAYIAYNSGVTGTATITGAGSKWSSSYLYVGDSGSGELTIEAGGQVSTGNGYLGRNSNSSGTATVTGAGSKWTNSWDLSIGRNGALTVTDGGTVTAETLYASLENLHGNGTITATKGAVLDCDLRFDAAHSTQQTIAFGSGGTLTVNTNGGTLGAGYKGKGSLTVAEGVAVSSFRGYLGLLSGSTGTATVTGTGSKWTNSSDLYCVGCSGSGSLTIMAGGQVSNTYGYLGYNAGSKGTATITGAGSTWANSSSLEVGHYGSGALTIEAGGEVSNNNGYLGYGASSTGTAIVTGTGSKWTNSRELYVGYSGSGALTIEAGGQVSNTYGWLGLFSSSTATVTGIGSKWTNSRELTVGRSGNGTLTIEAGGQVSNTYGWLGLFSSSTGAATVTGIGSKWTNSNYLTVGNSGSGALTIEAGGEVSNNNGYLGYDASSTGTATITGIGSKWNNGYEIYVGYYGRGMLAIEAGGQVSNYYGYLGYNSGSTGMTTVTGASSIWTNSGSLFVGYVGSGTLHIRDGGKVTASSINIRNSSSLLTLDVGSGSLLSVGDTGTFTNSGTVRILAGPQAAAGSQYAPIAATNWSGGGVYQAVGGTWDGDAHRFTVSPALTGVAGTPVSVDLALGQRVLVEDVASRQTLGASFLAKTGTGNSFSFTATTLAGAPMALLEDVLPPGQTFMSGWNMSAAGAGYKADEPVYISLGIPAGLERGALSLWKFDGGAWSSFSAADLSCNGGYASFTTTGVGGYAISAVPEPSLMVLLVGAAGGMLAVKRIRRREMMNNRPHMIWF